MWEHFLQMTWYNPIFMMVTIGAIWFIPGIVIRRVKAEKVRIATEKKQQKKIARLYPKDNTINKDK